MSNIIFENVDFSTNDFDFPFVVISTANDGLFSSTNCYYLPCIVHTFELHLKGTETFIERDKEITDLVFGENVRASNIRLVDVISDKSDTRTMWKHSSSFIASDLVNVLFRNSDLSNSSFLHSQLQNVEFSNLEMSNIEFQNVNLINTKFEDETINSEYWEYVNSQKIKPKDISNDIDVQKFSNPKKINLDVKFVDVIHEGLINWSMDLEMYGKLLFVADTDNHRILAFDINNFELISGFKSNIEQNCVTTNNWTLQQDCPPEMRNLPTSITFLDEKFFVAYGFQNDIQIFDKHGEFLAKFGNTGTHEGEFNEAFRISAYEDKLYVADSKNHRIQIFNSNGIFLKQFSTNVDSFSNSTPFDLDIDNNKIFVADSTRSSIIIFDLDGNLLNELQINSQIPISLSGIDIHDELIFVTDTKNHTVLILDLDGNMVLKLGKSGNHYGEFITPQNIISNGKQIFVSDSGNYRIQVFDLMNLSITSP